MKPAAHLLTWPTGNTTCVPGPVAPCYRNVRAEPLWKDPPLGLAQPDYEAASERMSRLSDGRSLADQPPEHAANIRRVVKHIIDAAF